MKWIENFQLFLFDLDGLLVDTENVHYEAYKEMLKKRGFDLKWDFFKFCEIAHFDENSLQKGVYCAFPDLFIKEPNWEILKKEKNIIFIDLLKTSKIKMLPGVESLLKELQYKNIKRCVVTNSFKIMTDLIRVKQPCLNTIPHWLTREDYLLPKPYPDGYLHAIKLYGKKGDKIIGFEDSLRGIKALQQTASIPVLINCFLDSRLEDMVSKEVFHFESFDKISENFFNK